MLKFKNVADKAEKVMIKNIKTKWPTENKTKDNTHKKTQRSLNKMAKC